MTQRPDSTLPKEEQKLHAAGSGPGAGEEPRLPGPISSSYWLVIAGGALTLAVIACYCAILYGGWHPFSFSPHYPAI